MMDPSTVCKKTRKVRGKLAEICRNETGLLTHITNGQRKGEKECGYQFRSRRWNCTTMRRSMKKILTKGMSKI